MKQRRVTSLNEVKRGLNELGQDTSEMFFVADNFGVSNGLTNLFPNFLETEVPYIVDDNRFGVLLSGEADVTVNLIDYKLTPGTIAYVGKGSTAVLHGSRGEVMLKGLVMHDDFMNLALHGRMPASFSGKDLNFYLKASPSEQKTVEDFIQLLWRVVHGEDGDYCMETIYGIVEALMYYYDFLRRKSTMSSGNPRSREREIFEKFIMLVNANCDRQRQLSFYADQLCLSERYLGTLVGRASGQPAKYWIDRAVVTKAKVMLRHSDLQVTQISDRLNFTNDSFFCKYFRRLTGMSPKDYRELKPE